MQTDVGETVDDGRSSLRLREYEAGDTPDTVEKKSGDGLNSGSMGNEGGVSKSIAICSCRCSISKGSFESLDESGLIAEENLTIVEELEASSLSPSSSSNSSILSADSSELVSGLFVCETLRFPLLFGDTGGG